MRKQVLILLLFFFCTISLFAQNEWRNKACPISHQGGGVSFALGTKAYVVGGDTMPPSSASISASVWEYDATSNVWTQKNNFPYSTNNPSCFVINDTAYVGLGLDNTSVYHTDFYRYDQVGDQWIQIQSFPGSARYAAMAFTLHGKGYVGCGHSTVVTNDFYMYDPQMNSWIMKANFSGSARQSGIGAAAGGKGYMGMGTGASTYDDLYQYNDSTNSWAQKNSFTNVGRFWSGAFVIDDGLYVMGGMNANGYFHDCWSYNAQNNGWSSQSGFGNLCPDSVFIQDAFVINGQAYIRPLDADTMLHILLEFGPADQDFLESISVLGNDTSYSNSFSRTLAAPDTSAIWSTGQTGSQITVTVPGVYTVRWNVSCGMATDTIIISSSVGIATVKGQDAISVYPNPVNGNNVDLQVSEELLNGQYEMYDMSGKLVYKNQILSEHSRLNLPESAGIYSLLIKANDNIYVQKIVKLQ
jgi:N-acetylneuraminic acid mutarotase